MQKNKFTSFVLAGIFTIIGFSALLPKHASAGHELVIAVDTAFVPFEFRQGGKYVGFDLDLWAAVAKEAGLEYRFQPMDFAGIIPGLLSHNVDAALAGIAINDARKKVIDFSDPYYDSGLAVMVTADSKLTGVQDLNGKRIAAKTGTATVAGSRKTCNHQNCACFRTSITPTWNYAPAASMRPCTTRPTYCITSRRWAQAKSRWSANRAWAISMALPLQKAVH